MILVGPSLGAAVAIDFADNHPEAVIISLQLLLLLNHRRCNVWESHISLSIFWHSTVSAVFIIQCNIFWILFLEGVGGGGGVSEFGCKKKGKGRFILVTFASGGVLPLWAYYAIDYPIQALPLNISNFHGALGNFKPCLIKIHCRRNQDSEWQGLVWTE